ncbi:MAG: gamma-glutamyl-gamma-aminobutyrate hydrolase family protein [Nitrospirota bacterium]|nr:gamma-glutamyl-gamma-aminobutyrate hydrolase family protein [Nitrospirota bacterium]
MTKPLIGVTADIEYRNDREYSYLQTRYCRAVVEAGGVPLVLPPCDSSVQAIGQLDGLLMTGGEDIHPRYFGEEPCAPLELSPDRRTDFETALLNEAIRLKKPILAICHGMQLLNVVFGGTLWQDLATQRPQSMPHRSSLDVPCSHTIAVSKGSLLEKMIGVTEFESASYHHQAVKDVGKGLVVTAQAPDGVIEAVELTGYPFLLGVQWHPEKTLESEVTRRLFRGFVESCKR